MQEISEEQIQRCIGTVGNDPRCDARNGKTISFWVAELVFKWLKENGYKIVKDDGL